MELFVKLTIVALSNTVLNTATLSQIGDLGPVLVWVCVLRESRASGRGVPQGGRHVVCVCEGWKGGEPSRARLSEVRSGQVHQVGKVR